MSPSDLGVFVLATRGAAADEAGGSSAVLVKVKAHRGEPANKEANIKQTRLFQAKMFPQNGTTGRIEQFSHGKSLAGKEV